ncbi:M64 family metallopeptidase [Seonamhaeicola sp.]|uniref:M64 family metallopeptidase n=1 Tax=Seonamhaeicola sp. TaxID=1912245 RepID=UPI002605C17D|nr:M64 family metallopeptidase [Seonamhaeicola sp.]
MRHYITYLLILSNIYFGFAQIFDVEPIKISGDDNKRINLVILSEGYQTSELSDFITDATNFTNDMFSQSPFSEYTNYFNVYAIKVDSNESGSDHPGTATDVTEPASPITSADTYFNTSYDSFGYHRLLYSSDYATISTVLANNFPSYDQALILVNSDVYGGSGGTYPFASTGVSANEIAIHELGHSLFNLKDEYYPGDALAAEAINMTQETSTSLVKWKNWIGINGIGIYPYGTSGTPATWNRPHQNCKMRYLGSPFCSVCKEGMIERIHDLVSPIDSYTPVSNTVNNPGFPLDFELTLLHPTNKDLERTWTLNSTNFANDVDAISLLEADLNDGANTLSVVVTDNNSFLKVDNHETIHVYTVNWTINYSSLGIDDILSEENRFKIDMFPNPASTLLNFKIESEVHSNLRINLVSLDGKKVKSAKLNAFSEINISRLNPGIYMANIYADNMLIASKKVIKN